MKKKYTYLVLLFSGFLIAQTSGITTIASSITPDLSAYGEAENYPGVGEYQIYYSSDNVLDKPIIVVDGFDPGDTRQFDGLYELLDFEGTNGLQNLADLVRAEDFDVIFLNFPTYTRTEDNVTVDGGADFIERNAMVLVELLNIINADKANASNPEANVIIGPSMGGLISRYALNYMEANALDADTRLWVSFDAPHHGANIPIGLQHQLNYLAFNETNGITEVQPLVNNLLKSSAARQLLIDHFEPHLASGSEVNFDPALTLPLPHPYRIQFENNINALTSSGFPENTRNISIINGSGIGNSYYAIGDSGDLVTNGYTVVDTTLPIEVNTGLGGTITINIEIDINFTPEAGVAQQVSRFFAPIPILPDIESVANSGTPNFDGVDAASGGLFDISGLTNTIGNSGPAVDFINALQIDKFNFIPSVSAIALDVTSGDIDWHQHVDNATNGGANNTPFDNVFLPDDNEPHVQLTDANVAFALDEILNPPLSILQNNAITFKVLRNPISNQLVLSSNEINNANISIADLTGKIVYNNNVTLSNNTSIPVNLTSGIYVLNIKTQNSNFNTKIIVSN